MWCKVRRIIKRKRKIEIGFVWRFFAQRENTCSEKNLGHNPPHFPSGPAVQENNRHGAVR
jgi:hypothetical protein